MGVEKLEISPLVEFGNKNSVKNHAINILSQEWPLNVRKLHAKVEVYRPGVSYHAVHKVVQQLVDDMVLKREKDGYMLSVEWLTKVNELVESIKLRHASGNSISLPKLSEFQEGESKTLLFDNLAEADKYRKHLHWEYFSGDPKFPYCATALHLRTPVVKSEASIQTLSAVKQADIDCYIAVEGDTPIDQWCADYYNNTNVRVQTGVSHGSTCETMVIGDVFTQLHLPERLVQRIREFFSNAGDISELNVSEFYQTVYLEPMQVKLVVSRNADIANQLRRQIMTYFEVEKLAFCDLENTLIDSRVVADAMEHLGKAGAFNEKGKDLLKAVQNFAKRKGDKSKFAPLAIKLYASAVKGQEVSDVESMLRNFWEDRSKQFIFKYAPRAFSVMRAKRRTVTITAFPEEVVRALASTFAFDDVICTQLEIQDGKFTGRVARNLAMPGAKRAAMQAWLENSGYTLDGSVGIGDSVDDITFLERTAFPIVVNPDAQLLKVAKLNKWFVFDGKDQARLLAHVKKTLKGDENGGVKDE